MNSVTSAGRIPENVSESERAMVMAGLAKDVDAVNQYAAPIHAATIHGASSERRWPSTTSNRPNVATPSASHWLGPVRKWVDSCQTGNSNITCASNPPTQHPMILAAAYISASRHAS